MKKLLITSLLIVGFSLLLTGCSEQSGMSMGNDGDMQKPIVKIGVIAPLSGPASTYGTDIVNAINDGFEGYTNDKVEVKLIFEDGKCEGKASIDAVQKLINVDQVDFILGGACSGETVAAGKIAQQNKVLMLSPTASSPEISSIGDYVYRFWNDAHASLGAASYLSENYPNLAMIVEDTEYAKALADKLKEEYKGTITKDLNFLSTEKDFSILAKAIEKNKDSIDGIVVITQTEATTIPVMKSLDELGLIDEYRGDVMGAYWFSTETIQNEIGDLVEGNVEVQSAGLASMGPLSQGYMEGFYKEHGVQGLDLMIPLAREAIQIYLDGIDAGNYDTESMRSYFNTITKNNPRTGYFGKYYFDKYGDAIGLKYVVQKIVDGKGVVIE